MVPRRGRIGKVNIQMLDARLQKSGFFGNFLPLSARMQKNYGILENSA
jgi:hypothetical protein